MSSVRQGVLRNNDKNDFKWSLIFTCVIPGAFLNVFFFFSQWGFKEKKLEKNQNLKAAIWLPGSNLHQGVRRLGSPQFHGIPISHSPPNLRDSPRGISTPADFARIHILFSDNLKNGE